MRIGSINISTPLEFQSWWPFSKIQLCSIENQDDPIYEVNLRVFPIAYHRLKMQLCSWSLLSKKMKTGGFQKCKVHCCNFKDFKVTCLQSLATPGFEPTPPAWVKREPFVTHAGCMGSNPGVAKLWRLVTLKSLKLQQCTLHVWKPLLFIFLDKGDQECSCILRLSGIPLAGPYLGISDHGC